MQRFALCSLPVLYLHSGGHELEIQKAWKDQAHSGNRSSGLGAGELRNISVREKLWNTFLF